MFSIKKRKYRGDGDGINWPNSQSGSVVATRDPFGPRPFSPHIATVGYDYDFHRGIDIPITEGDNLYSPINGAIIRKHYCHFGWQYENMLQEFVISDLSSSLVCSVANNGLHLICSRVGNTNFPFGIETLSAKSERISPKADDWAFELQLSSTIGLPAGAIGLGIFSNNKDEFVALEYDGSLFTTRASGSNSFAANGSTFAASGKDWMKVYYSSSADRFHWYHSTDGGLWTEITSSESARTFASAPSASFVPTLYWKSSDTSATAVTASLKQLNWVDVSYTIGRFGNWVEIGGDNKKIIMVHFRNLEVNIGDFVSAGTVIGSSGRTGFDTRSGRVLHEHGHIEYVTNNNHLYSNDEPINPLGPGLLPRNNSDANVSVIRSTANDPNGTDSHLLTITVAREDQDFDLNSISLTGTSATRTINFNSRSGLNADNDIPLENGVYIVPERFDEDDSAYTVAVYFNKSTVGATFVSYAILDTAGTTIASE